MLRRSRPSRHAGGAGGDGAPLSGLGLAGRRFSVHKGIAPCASISTAQMPHARKPIVTAIVTRSIVTEVSMRMPPDSPPLTRSPIHAIIATLTLVYLTLSPQRDVLWP